jgi:hypothetical protein
MKQIQITPESILGLSKQVLESEDWWQMTQHLLLRPWFQRRWVIQEVALGHDSTVYCGFHKMSWHWFTNGLLKIETIAKEQHIGVDQNLSNAIDAVLRLRLHSKEMLKLLIEFRTSICIDRRDRVFALVSLVEDIKQPAVGSSVVQQRGRRSLVDYGKNWIDIYCHLAEYYIYTGKLSELLQHRFMFGCLSDVLNDPFIPSYVPDWANELPFEYSKFGQHTSIEELSKLPEPGPDWGFVHAAAVATNTWPPPSTFMRGIDTEDPCAWRIKVCQLMAYVLLDQFMPVDEAVKKRLGIDFNLFVTEPSKTWTNAWLKLLSTCFASNESPDQGRDETVCEFLTKVFKTHNLFFKRKPVSSNSHLLNSSRNRSSRG